MSTSNPPNQIAEAGAAIPAYIVLNGAAVSSGNPLPTLGSGGSLSDVLLTDSAGALFIARDTGTTITYHNMNTNAAYTPVGTIQVADTLAQGTDNTGVSQLKTGTGVRGWLSTLANTVSSGLLKVTQYIGGSAVSSGNPVPVFDGYGAPQVATWTSATADNTALTSNTAGMDCVAVTIQPTGTFTGGAVIFEVFDGANWVPIKCARESSYNTDSTYNLAGINTIQGWTIPAAAYPQSRARLSSAITGAGASLLITTIASSAPDTSVVTAGLDPSSSLPAGTNAIGTVTVATGGATVVAGQTKLAASGTAQQLGSNALVNGVVITAPTSNTGTITLGSSTVNNWVGGTGNGYPLSPGQSFAFSVSNTNAIWFNGTVTGDSISFGGN